MKLNKTIPRSMLFLVVWIVPSLVFAQLVVNPPTKGCWPFEPLTESTTPLGEIVWLLAVFMMGFWLLTGLLPWIAARTLRRRGRRIDKALSVERCR